MEQDFIDQVFSFGFVNKDELSEAGKKDVYTVLKCFFPRIMCFFNGSKMVFFTVG